MYNNEEQFHLSTPSGLTDSNVRYGIGVLFSHEEFHILLERLTELNIFIESGKLTVWWMDPLIPWSDRLSQVLVMMGGMQQIQLDLSIDGLF